MLASLVDRPGGFRDMKFQDLRREMGLYCWPVNVEMWSEDEDAFVAELHRWTAMNEVERNFDDYRYFMGCPGGFLDDYDKIESVDRGVVMVRDGEWPRGTVLKNGVEDSDADRDRVNQTFISLCWDPPPYRDGIFDPNASYERHAVTLRAYEHVYKRQMLMFKLLIYVVDEIRDKILGRMPHATQARCRGCASCGARASRGHLLRQCAHCKLVCYCSRACQRADWADHVGLCQAADKCQGIDMKVIATTYRNSNESNSFSPTNVVIVS